MSKYVKQLITDSLRQRLEGVHDALLVNVIGLNANTANRLRAELKDKNIHILVVKNSLARRATEGTSLGALFADTIEGSSALCWGSTDVVALAKEITKLSRDDKLPAFQTRGGVMDGERLTADQIEDVSRWPSREEMLSILVGQILSPGATLAGQLLGPGGALASQIGERGKEAEGEGGTEAAPAEAAADAPPAA
jgi:large subunit ribosomal protein L10